MLWRPIASLLLLPCRPWSTGAAARRSRGGGGHAVSLAGVESSCPPLLAGWLTGAPVQAAGAHLDAPSDAYARGRLPSSAPAVASASFRFVHFVRFLSRLLRLPLCRSPSTSCSLLLYCRSPGACGLHCPVVPARYALLGRCLSVCLSVAASLWGTRHLELAGSLDALENFGDFLLQRVSLCESSHLWLPHRRGGCLRGAGHAAG